MNQPQVYIYVCSLLNLPPTPLVHFFFKVVTVSFRHCAVLSRSIMSDSS